MYQSGKINHSPSASEIIPGIWVGDMFSAGDPRFLEQEKIGVVINCTKDLPFLDLPQVKYRYRVPVHDNLDPNEIASMSKFLGEIVGIINAYHSKGHQILIHCHAGMQRSACVFLVFHIQYHTRDFQKSYQLMKSRRPMVFTPSINFLPAVRRYFQDQSR
jgi:hypothetical protein